MASYESAVIPETRRTAFNPLQGKDMTRAERRRRRDVFFNRTMEMVSAWRIDGDDRQWLARRFMKHRRKCSCEMCQHRNRRPELKGIDPAELDGVSASLSRDGKPHLV